MCLLAKTVSKYNQRKWLKLLRWTVVIVCRMYGHFFFVASLELFSARIYYLKMTVLGDSPGQFGHIIQTLYSKFLHFEKKIFFTYVPKKALWGYKYVWPLFFQPFFRAIWIFQVRWAGVNHQKFISESPVQNFGKSRRSRESLIIEGPVSLDSVRNFVQFTFLKSFSIFNGSKDKTNFLLFSIFLDNTNLTKM